MKKCMLVMLGCCIVLQFSSAKASFGPSEYIDMAEIGIMGNSFLPTRIPQHEFIGKFKNKLEKRSQILGISLAGNDMRDECFKEITESLGNKEKLSKLEVLDLSNNLLTEKSAFSLIEWLKNSNCIINIYNNKIISAKKIKSLFDGFVEAVEQSSNKRASREKIKVVAQKSMERIIFISRSYAYKIRKQKIPDIIYEDLIKDKTLNKEWFETSVKFYKNPVFKKLEEIKNLRKHQCFLEHMKTLSITANELKKENIMEEEGIGSDDDSFTEAWKAMGPTGPTGP